MTDAPDHLKIFYSKHHQIILVSNENFCHIINFINVGTFKICIACTMHLSKSYFTLYSNL